MGTYSARARIIPKGEGKGPLANECPVKFEPLGTDVSNNQFEYLPNER